MTRNSTLALLSLGLLKFQTVLAVFALISAITGCGQLMTEAPSKGDLFDAPFPELSPELNLMFSRGDEAFGKAFTIDEGLGPIFNNVSCASCHSGDGRGSKQNIFLRFSRGSDLAILEGGPQLQTQSIPGVSPEVLPLGVHSSPRMPPPVFGVGLIEAIPADTILSRSDPDDADGDGISGRPNWVEAPEYVPGYEVGGGGGPQLGRFGRKANVSSLLQQIVAAYLQDIGITNDFTPVENNHPLGGGYAMGDAVADPEIPAGTVVDVLAYLRLLSPPLPGVDTPEIQSGRALFSQINCASCHTPYMTTGRHQIPQLSNTEVWLYSDLLIHDMGSGLADNRPDGSADGQEWKTAPLWGMRVVGDFLDNPGFLHDGRASTVEEAILLHGGEAQAARDSFIAMPGADRAALLKFVESR